MLAGYPRAPWRLVLQARPFLTWMALLMAKGNVLFGEFRLDIFNAWDIGFAMAVVRCWAYFDKVADLMN